MHVNFNIGRSRCIIKNRQSIVFVHNLRELDRVRQNTSNIARRGKATDQGKASRRPLLKLEIELVVIWVAELIFADSLDVAIRVEPRQLGGMVLRWADENDWWG